MISKSAGKVIWTGENGERIEFPEGTTPDEVNEFVQRHRGGRTNADGTRRPRIDTTKAKR
jgi:hypothetical protein